MSSERRDAIAVAELTDCTPFVYHPAPGWMGERDSVPASGNAMAADLSDQETAKGAGADHIAKQSETRAWEEGFREGQARSRAEYDAALVQQREAVLDALREFAEDRAAYFQRVEGEVVNLALAIARKILRREAQLDPLLLSGLVRVALEKIAAGQTVRVRVHPSQVGVWQDYFGAASGLQVTPEWVGDPAMELQQCRIESEMGSTDLNIESQLKEIEQGLFDLLAQRPSAR